jgi:membrane-associated HD superfamily phosphohydrolase
MAQLTAIRSAFVFTLAKMRHDRVAYPQSPGGTTRHDDKDALPS